MAWPPGCTRLDGGAGDGAASGPTEDGAHDGGEEEVVGPVGEATDGGAHDGVEGAILLLCYS